MRGRLGQLAVVVVVGLAAGGGAALAMRSGDPATIQACKNVTNGELRVVDDPAQCRQHETPLSWSSGGAAASVQIVTGEHEFTVAEGNRYGLVDAACPAGTKVVGGGWSFDNQNAWVQQSYPVGESGWEVYAGLSNSGPAYPQAVTVTVYASCLG